MGRPATYDEDAVIGAALEQFWARGFNGSSVDLLVAETGLNKHSLYQVFEGKSGLFRRVLERYLARHAAHYLACFAERRGIDALRCYFERVLRRPDPRGCLVVNTAVELGAGDPACARLMGAYYARIADCFASAIREGQEEGSIRADLDARESAAWLLRATQGLAVSARLGARPRPRADSLLALLAVPGARN